MDGKEIRSFIFYPRSLTLLLQGKRPDVLAILTCTAIAPACAGEKKALSCRLRSRL